MNDFLQRLGFWTCHFNILAVGAVLTSAFVVQFGAGELPCPLCIVQRMGMLLAILGTAAILLAARKGNVTPSEYATGYGMSILGAIVGGAGSLRQIALHVCDSGPGAGYGSPIMGYHLYTWALVVFTVVVAVSGFNLFSCRWLDPHRIQFGLFSKLTVWFVALLLAANMVAVFVEAGFHAFLPDNPTSYRLLDDLGLGASSGSDEANSILSAP
ncbi:MAG: disulfide bond formation protein B [Planctomycetota bacterium]|nr:disulfide bond formation protein B [Planctomycetota bacterium]MDA1105813.1 disulfide bond formation protein B [Planctomycetota bacterium]